MGPVSIAIEGDKELGLSYLPEAQQLLHKLRSQMAPGGIATSRAYMDLPDGAYAYAISAMGVEAIRIVAGPGASDALTDARAYLREPDFLSGVVVKGRINEGAMRDLIPTAATAQRHQMQAGIAQPVKRLAVKLHSDLGEADGFAQVAAIKPTNYSGTMKEVIQALLGFGKQNLQSIYERFEKPTSQSADQVVPTAYERAVATNGLQVAYDSRFYRTHGITWAQDGKPWLVEIGANRGVLAMPLPLHETTKTAKFRQKLDRMGDSDGLLLLNRFGGFPTGEPFPIREALESAIRAGMVLRLAKREDLQRFYQHSAYSSAMGWAFNERGSEAHNTGYRYGTDGAQIGSHFCIALRIGGMVTVADNPQAKSLIAVISKRVKYLGDRAAILKWKAQRLARDQIADVLRVLAESGEMAALDALDAITLTPIATGSAGLSLASEGAIWWPSIRSPQIKFHEPLLGYLLSHDMTPNAPAAPRDCDTVMHVFFKGNELKVCKFFHRANQTVSDRRESDEEECMYVGSWTSTQETGRSVPSMFYTTDYDDREEVGGTKTVLKTTGRDLGYTDCQYGDDPSYPPRGWMTRVKTFRMNSKEVYREGVTRKAAIAVPEGLREGYYYAKMDFVSLQRVTEGMNYKTLYDPYSYETWRNFPGWTSGHDPHPSGCGPVTRRTVRYQLYDETACSDLANAGPWADVCDDAESMAYHIGLPAAWSRTTTTLNKSTLNVELVCNSERTPMRTNLFETENQYFDGGFWFIPSPDPETGLVAFIHAMHNALGDGDALKFNPNINDSESRVVGKPDHPQMLTEPINFIGVVNGI